MDTTRDFNVQNGAVSFITVYFNLLHALVGDRVTYCSFIGNLLEFRSYRFTYDSNNNLTLGYGVIPELDLFVNEHNKGELRLPDKRISTIGFEIINVFLLQFNEDEMFPNLPREDVEDVPRIILECVFLDCPNIDHFEVETGLNLLGITVGSRIGVNISKSHSNGHKYLKMVKISNISDHSKVLESVITYLPDIEVLSFDYFLHHDNATFNMFNLFDNHDIDLTGFASLEYFYFEASVRDITALSVIYSFKYFDGDKKKYSYS